MGFVVSKSCGSFERSCQSIPVGRLCPPPPHTHAGIWVRINRARRLNCHSNPNSWDIGKMPASQTRFGNFFLERNISLPAGYHIPVLGCPPGVQQQQQAQHLAAMAAGVPITYSGLQGYHFIPYPHHRHMAHMVSSEFTKCSTHYTKSSTVSVPTFSENRTAFE